MLANAQPMSAVTMRAWRRTRLLTLGQIPLTSRRNGVREQELWESGDNTSDIEGGVPESGPFVVEELRAFGIDDVVG